MSVLPQTSVHAISPQTSVLAKSISTLPSFIGAISPCKVAYKELSEASINGIVEVTKPSIPIYLDTLGFNDKDT